jgi:hypothetical protein
MPNEFFLNDCLPERARNGADVVALFRNMVTEYKVMRQNEALNLVQNWVTSDVVDKVSLCGLNLKNLLGQLKSDRTLYQYALRLVVGGIPITYREQELAGDNEIEKDYLCNARNAHKLLVAQKLAMTAATLPVEDSLCQDALNLVFTDPGTEEKTVKQIRNWYINNSTTIIQLLTPPLPTNDMPWERLLALLGQHGKVVYSKMFEDDWKTLGLETQRLVVCRFEDALNGGLLFPANNNNKNIVKQDEKDRTSKVHELRQIGNGFRIYFECDTDAIYIALYASKTYHHGKDQEADFRLAKTIVERLRRNSNS